MSNEHDSSGDKKIVVRPNGPYVVHGHVPLVRKTQVVSECGEPLTWKKEGALDTPETYRLCRCGQSRDKPFCDNTHREVGFDGTESADTDPTSERQLTYPGGTRIAVKHDDDLCIASGFCGTRNAHIGQMVPETEDPDVRSQVIAMVERCPSGSLTYAMAEGEADIEPDLPAQVAVTTDILAEGPVEGALWVTGNIPIRRADGQPLETRNRVTLCRCGRSQTKPLCDGRHRTEGECRPQSPRARPDVGS
jgi:CDGSH-type Zn-finger protein